MAVLKYIAIYAGLWPSRAGVRRAALVAIVLTLAALAGVASVDLAGQLARPGVVYFDAPASVPARIEPAPAMPQVAPPVELPTIEPAPAQPVGELVRVRLSHYQPWLGPPNCGVFVAGECVSAMASGLDWREWIDRAAACPKSWPYWTQLQLPGGETFVCLDRGSAIRYGQDGVPWVDLLLAGQPPVPFGSVVEVTVTWPAGAQ